MSVSPFDHRWLSDLLGDDQIAPQFEPQAELREMLHFEAALALSEGAEGVIPVDSARFIAAHVGKFVADNDALRTATARDGVVVPEIVRQLREFLRAHGQYVHFGATSQDVIDTSLVLRLRPVLTELDDRLHRLSNALGDLDRRFGSNSIMGHTRMQDAITIRAGDRVSAWREPIARHFERLAELTPRLLVLQFGGAAGTLDQLGDKGYAVAVRLAEALGLALPPHQWHAQRDNFAELASWLSLVCGSLGKFGADVALMAQNAVGEIALADGGSSSAMPHKQNPVRAEILVTLARFNATLVGGMHAALIHEQERSGSAWSLEWMILPQMVMTTAASLRTALTLCGEITRIGGH